jgi:hypothetical protein
MSPKDSPGFYVFFFETESHYVAQMDLDSPASISWDYGFIPCPGIILFLEGEGSLGPCSSQATSKHCIPELQLQPSLVRFKGQWILVITRKSGTQIYLLRLKFYKMP